MADEFMHNLVCEDGELAQEFMYVPPLICTTPTGPVSNVVYIPPAIETTVPTESVTVPTVCNKLQCSRSSNFTCTKCPSDEISPSSQERMAKQRQDIVPTKTLAANTYADRKF